MASKLTEKLKVGKNVWKNYVAESQKLYCTDPNMRVNNSVLESGSSSTTPTDIYSFGNKSVPRGVRPKQDFNVEGFDDIVGLESGLLPKGASNMLDVNTA